VRFVGGITEKVSTAGAESAGNSDTSSEEERPSSPLKLRRRKKRSIEEQMADDATRRARIDGNSPSSSLEALTSSLPHPFPALPTGNPPHRQAESTVGRGGMLDKKVPLNGPFVAEEEAANLLAAQEAQRSRGLFCGPGRPHPSTL